MESTVKNQINRVKMLQEIIDEKLTAHENDVKDYEKWESERPDDGRYHWYPHSKRVKPSEIKRLMLVQRQEMIRLEKLL